MKKSIVLVLISLCLVAGKLSAASIPSNTGGCSGFSLSGGECLLSGSNNPSITGEDHNDIFTNNGSFNHFTNVVKYEGSTAIWDGSVFSLSDSEFDRFDQIAIGIKAGKSWAVFLVQTLSEPFTFSSSPNRAISHITIYGAGVSEVPLPAAAWLFLTGLAGMSWMKKRKQKRDQLQAA